MSVHDPQLFKEFMNSTIMSSMSGTMENGEGKMIPLTLMKLKSKTPTAKSFDEMRNHVKYGDKDGLEIKYIICIDNKTNWVTEELYDVIHHTMYTQQSKLDSIPYEIGNNKRRRKC